MKSKYINYIILATISLTAVFYAIDYFTEAIPVIILDILKWVSVAGLILFGIKKRSLTTWILVCLVIGASIGHQWPEAGQSLQVLSKIFLKLIKTIVGPLIFATLVYGIDGHSDIKLVVRMGWK